MSVLKAGTRLKSAVCNTEVMVVMAPKEAVEVTCGGTPLVEMNADKPEGGSIAEGADGGTQMGKRYVNEDGNLELLCTKPGDGALGADGALLTAKGAKPLPSSD
jgi:hypothetical protein